MKKILIIILSILVSAFSLSSCTKEGTPKKSESKTTQPSSSTRSTPSTYSGSTFSGNSGNSTTDKYAVIKTETENGTVYSTITKKGSDGYYGKIELTMKDGKIEDVKFNIIDPEGLVFDENYYQYYVPNQLYMNQCKNDYKGLLTYIPELIKKQDINEVDNISGASWSRIKLKEAVDKVMEEVNKNK